MSQISVESTTLSLPDVSHGPCFTYVLYLLPNPCLERLVKTSIRNHTISLHFTNCTSSQVNDLLYTSTGPFSWSDVNLPVPRLVRRRHMNTRQEPVRWSGEIRNVYPTLSWTKFRTLLCSTLLHHLFLDRLRGPLNWSVRRSATLILSYSILRVEFKFHKRRKEIKNFGEESTVFFSCIVIRIKIVCLRWWLRVSIY